MKYPVFKPNPSPDIANKLSQAFLNGEVSGSFGAAIEDLNNFYQLTHSGYFATSCSSGTAALHLCCLALGVNVQSNVAVANITNMASFFAPIYCGANVYPVEVNEQSGLICPRELDNLCQLVNIDYLIIVHLYGQLCDVSAVKFLAKKYNFKVIEDCAESHFASFDNKFAGSFFDASAFSFYANKIIWSGEGGLCLFKNQLDLDRANYLKALGFSSDSNDPSRFYHNDIAFNYRLSNLNCLIAYENSKNYTHLIEARYRIASIYNELFNGKHYIYSLPVDKPRLKVYWVYFIELTQAAIDSFDSKQDLFLSLQKHGIQCRDFFYPANHQPFLINFAKSKDYKLDPCSSAFVNSMSFYKRGIYLPFYEGLEVNDIQYIVNALDQIFNV